MSDFSSILLRLPGSRVKPYGGAYLVKYGTMSMLLEEPYAAYKLYRVQEDLLKMEQMLSTPSKIIHHFALCLNGEFERPYKLPKFSIAIEQRFQQPPIVLSSYDRGTLRCYVKPGLDGHILVTTMKLYKLYEKLKEEHNATN